MRAVTPASLERPPGRCWRGRHGAPSSITQSGFTLIELVAVIVIVGILGAATLPELLGSQAFQQRGYADEVADALRYARKTAMATSCNVRFVTDAATGGYVAMQRSASGNTCSAGGNWTSPVLRGDGTALASSPPADVILSTSTTAEFDAAGRIAGAAPADIAVATFSIVIDPSSGRVSVLP